MKTSNPYRTHRNPEWYLRRWNLKNWVEPLFMLRNTAQGQPLVYMRYQDIIGNQTRTMERSIRAGYALLISYMHVHQPLKPAPLEQALFIELKPDCLSLCKYLVSEDEITVMKNAIGYFSYSFQNEKILNALLGYITRKPLFYLSDALRADMLSDWLTFIMMFEQSPVHAVFTGSEEIINTLDLGPEPSDLEDLD